MGSGIDTEYHLPRLSDSSQNQAQSIVVPIKPITFIHTGKNHPSIITDTPVIILNRCKIPTIPKIEPATRRPRILEFIMLKCFKRLISLFQANQIHFASLYPYKPDSDMTEYLQVSFPTYKRFSILQYCLGSTDVRVPLPDRMTDMFSTKVQYYRCQANHHCPSTPYLHILNLV